MEHRRFNLKLAMSAGCALVVLAAATMANAEERTFSVASTKATDAIPEFARQAGIQIVAPAEKLRGLNTPAIQGRYDTREALAMLIQGTGLHVASDDGRTVMLAADPQSGSAAGDGADGTVAELVVTAQKREENIQDVPIAISAFSEKSLQEQKIEGGFDLLKAIPNVTFSKNNFTSYNFSIRGIGTKAVSATTDPAVAVAFNSSPMIVNRLFEQEYVDIERVEVLRGPQGTLYGRNATSGVINVISAKPDLKDFKGWLKGEVGNYNTKRVSAMVNVPILEDKLAVRFAGALTKRDGYGYNDVTKSDVDGRDLWSARLTVGFEPTERFHGNLVWERFNENDERARTSKQLCHTDPGVMTIGSVTLRNEMAAGILSQGCLPGSLYDAGAFGAPNGNSLPYIFALRSTKESSVLPLFVDPYNGLQQSQDLREISSRFDPIYRAKADVVELNLEYDLTPQLTLVSQTLYNKDSVYSTQDYNRFNTRPIFNNGLNADGTYNGGCQLTPDDTNGGIGPGPENDCPGGFFTDPQLGTSNTIVLQDISQGRSRQFSQEFRLQSDFDGPVNFSVGANYVDFKVNIDYYVLSNTFTLVARDLLGGESDQTYQDDTEWSVIIDSNPLESISGTGQNYYRSQNPYQLKSLSAFGEVYWQMRDDLKLTAGLRYTDDKKDFELWPTVLLNNEYIPYKQQGEINQHWGEFSGRLGIDWKPDLSFTDDTMLYAFYSRGYKAGGANPPNMALITFPNNPAAIKVPQTALHPATFEPEFVNAFEVGSKNVLMGGGLIFNTTAFYYDYKDYQISQIVDRLALNENFDASVWGLEFEAIFSPTRNLRFNANLGYLDTKVADGEKSIDIMNRTAGNEDWMVMKNWIQYPSNCIVPKGFVEDAVPAWRAGPLGNNSGPEFTDLQALMYLFASPCSGMYASDYVGFTGFPLHYTFTGVAYDPFDPHGADAWGLSTEEANWGAGIATDLSGNELPNAPHWTMNIGAQYGFDFLEGWRGTVRADAYWQSQSWARIYNLGTYDKLHGWYNANLSVWVENDDGLKVEAYVKNLLDADPITDAFLNSDDSGLTTNVFVLDPRLIGVSIRKEF